MNAKTQSSAKALVRVVDVDPDLCTNCHKCISACPSKFTNNALGTHVAVDHNLCIGCGSCVQVCPAEARFIVDDTQTFIEASKRGTKMVAIVAPSVASNFPDQYLQLNTWLKTQGVEALFDVSFGAELTVKSYVTYIKEKSPKIVISSACPAIVSYIETQEPQLLPFVAPIDSPMAHTIKMIRERFPAYKDHQMVAISPCIAKKREFESLGMNVLNVTMTRLSKHMREKKVDLSLLAPTGYSSPDPERGVSFPTPGGMIKTVAREFPEVDRASRKIEGVGAIYKYLQGLEAGIREGNVPLLIDCLNCEMGCNGGTGTDCWDASPDALEQAVAKRVSQMKEHWCSLAPEAASPSEAIAPVLDEFWAQGAFERQYSDSSGYMDENIRMPPESEIQEIFKAKLNKQSSKEELNCNACGYGKCRLMAVAIANGKNEPKNCYLFTQKEVQAEKKLMQIMKDGMSDCVFLMDREYRFQENHSVKLPALFERESLEGCDLVSLLAEFSTPAEVETYRAYLELIFSRNLKDTQIASMNPLREKTIVFKKVGTTKEKHLRFTFANKIRVEGQDLVNVTVYDITKEVELRNEVEARKQENSAEVEQLSSLFHIGDVRVIKDFIYDAETNIDAINQIIKTDETPRTRLMAIVNILHAIKGDALQLNLMDIAKYLDEVENTILELCKQPEENIVYDDLLRVSIKINNVRSNVREIDALTAKIQMFNAADVPVASRFLDRLAATIEANAGNLGKRIVLANRQEGGEHLIDDKVLFYQGWANQETNNRYRKLFKDFIVQCVRNSLYHGIEPVAAREAKAKDPQGQIRITTRTGGKFIMVTVSDDGSGLDPVTVVRKAKQFPALRQSIDFSKPLGEAAVIQILCHDGFSTAGQASMLAGKGVGLSYVAGAAKELGGGLRLGTQKDKGFQLSLVLPAAT